MTTKGNRMSEPTAIEVFKNWDNYWTDGDFAELYGEDK